MDRGFAGKDAMIVRDLTNWTTKLVGIDAGASGVVSPYDNVTSVSPNWTLPEQLGSDHSWRSSGITLAQLLWGLNKFLTPVIIAAGMVGNVTSFLVFVRTHVRRLSSSVYLAALAVADTGFLLQLLFTWLNYVRVFLFHRDGWCQAIVYLSYVCSFLSVWYVVGFTIERYIAVCYPLRRQDMCTPLRAKKVVLLLALFACAAYSFGAWTSGVVDPGADRGKPQCQPLPQYRRLVIVFNNIDTVITLILPSTTIFVLNVRLVIKIRYFYDKRLGMTPSYSVPTASPPHATIPKDHDTNGDASGHYSKASVKASASSSGACTDQAQAASMRKRSQITMTKMLLVVSTIFLVLNLPSHAIRVHAFAMAFIDPRYQPSYTTIVLQQLFTFISYVNFSINFLLYSLCGKNFRSALVRMCACGASPYRRQGNFLPSGLLSRAPTGRFDSATDNTMKSFISNAARSKANNIPQETEEL